MATATIDTADNQQSIQTQYAEIVWLCPKTTPKRVRSHRSLEAAIRGLTGKHATTIGHELRLAFARYLKHGHFSLNQRVLDAVHGATCRKQLMKVVGSFSAVVTSHRPNGQAKHRVFTFPGVKKAEKKAPTYNGRGDRLVVGKDWIVWRLVDCAWMWGRYERWSEWCRENGHEQRLDFGGTTDWGTATLESLDGYELPTTTANTATPEKQEACQAHLDKLTKTGVLRMVYRRHGRMYHPLTNVCKVDKRRCLTDCVARAEVDIHACYPTFLTGWLPPSDERTRLVEVLQRGCFYVAFEPVYDAFAMRKRAEMQEAGCSAEDISERLKGVKVEFQRQCLFGRDMRPESTPLLQEMKRLYPALARLVGYLRQREGVTGLSHMLTRAEGKLFVDTIIPALYALGIPVDGAHDGLGVPEDRADEVRRIVERIAYRQLGFVPGISIKR